MGRRAERSRDDVLAAAGAVVAARGAQSTRFADVTAVTGVGVSTLQYWFGSREDMLLAVFRFAARKDFEEISAGLEEHKDPWARLVLIATGLTGSDVGWRLWVESWRWAVRDPALRGEVLGDYQRWRELIAAEVAAGVRKRVFTTKAAPLDVARQALALIDGLALPVALGDDTFVASDLLVDALGRLVGRRASAG
ncbi:MAG: TetR family transcriptional regulator C-terminal domain-containing protein [Actinoplanes sp.]